MISEKDIVGKTEEEAEIALTNAGVRYRIVRRDDEHYVVTMDLRTDRFNLEIDSGYVTRVKMG